MRILIFEYITGGGFAGMDLPVSLAQEGGLMLTALLRDFASLAEHEIVVMLDERCVPQFADKNILVIPVKATDNQLATFNTALQNCEAVWLIAPETNAILCNLTQQAEAANKRLLSCPSSAIAKTADKFQTFTVLTTHAIATIATQRLDFQCDEFPCVIKSVDGVGCENNFFIQNQTEFQQLFSQITQPHNYLLQPFIKGDNLSLSAIFNSGTAELICVNHQHLEIKNQQFKLTACEVNIAVENKARFQDLLNQIAHALPDLFGYVGIDIIISAEAIYIIEINPRLTSSYAGIHQALGLNIADLVLQSLHQKIVMNPSRSQTVFVDLENRNVN